MVAPRREPAGPVTCAGGGRLARSQTLDCGTPEARLGKPPRGAPSRSEPLPARAPPRPLAGGEGGRRGRGKTGAGAVVSASPTRAQVPRRGAGVWAAARWAGGAERGRWPGALLGESQWTCAPRAEAGGGKKEITGGGVG